MSTVKFQLSKISAIAFLLRKFQIIQFWRIFLIKSNLFRFKKNPAKSEIFKIIIKRKIRESLKGLFFFAWGVSHPTVHKYNIISFEAKQSYGSLLIVLKNLEQFGCMHIYRYWHIRSLQKYGVQRSSTFRRN